MMQRLARRLYPYGAVRTVLRGPVRKARYVVAPSMVDTTMYGELSDDVASRFLEDLTIKRYCTHEEVEHVVSFFTSKEAGCVTGQVLYLGFAG